MRETDTTRRIRTYKWTALHCKKNLSLNSPVQVGQVSYPKKEQAVPVGTCIDRRKRSDDSCASGDKEMEKNDECRFAILQAGGDRERSAIRRRVGGGKVASAGGSHWHDLPDDRSLSVVTKRDATARRHTRVGNLRLAPPNNFDSGEYGQAACILRVAVAQVGQKRKSSGWKLSVSFASFCLSRHIFCCWNRLP